MIRLFDVLRFICNFVCFFFFFNDTATTEIYTLSLHDALPIHAQHRCVQLVDFARLRVRNLLVRRSEEHTSELQSLTNLVCRLLLEKKKHVSSRTWKHYHKAVEKQHGYQRSNHKYRTRDHIQKE